MVKPDNPLSNRWRRTSRTLTLVVLGLGLLSMGSWLLAYLNVWPGFFTTPFMKVNTAVALILSAGSLWCLHLELKTIAWLGILLIVAAAFITLADYLWQLQLGVDQWLLPDPSAATINNSPGRLLVLRALIFFFLALAMLLFSLKHFTLGQLLAAVIFMTAYVALISNFFRIRGFPDREQYLIISSYPAFSFLLLSLALLLFCPAQGWMKLLSSKYVGGTLARSAFIYFLLVSPVLIGFYLHSLSNWQFSPGLGILFLFLLTCSITLPVTFFFLQHLNKLDAQLKRAHNHLQVANTDLSVRNEDLSEALDEVKASNRELAVMTKEALLSSQALEHKNTELSRLNQSLDYIVQMASHDLKSPVFNLELLVQELKQTLPTNISPECDRLLTMVESSILSLKSTISGLTQIIRSQQIIIGLEVKVSFSKLLQEIQQELSQEIAQTQAQLHLHLAVDIIEFSRLHLHSVLLNLYSNALKYRHPNRPPLIKITTQPVAGGITVQFSDNGLGMSGYQVNHLFALFKRFHKHVEGTGIGLYIVKQTIQNYGGTIQVESTEGQGTRFIIFLPQKSQ